MSEYLQHSERRSLLPSGLALEDAMLDPVRDRERLLTYAESQGENFDELVESAAGTIHRRTTPLTDAEALMLAEQDGERFDGLG